MKRRAVDPSLRTLGDYDLLECVGEGSAAAVYKGQHRPSGRVVAVKVMSNRWAGNPVLMQRFELEFQAARKLDHPNLVRALEYGSVGDRPYFVMEFIEGRSLGSMLEKGGALPEATAVRLIGQVAQALDAAHRQDLIHRDIKPDNILVTAEGRAVLTDLGLVKQLTGDADLTRTGRGLGTPNFMAPEQFQDAKNADVRCDVYALAATLYQTVTGQLPFDAASPLAVWRAKMLGKLTAPRDLAPGLSERAERAILRALDPDPNRRTATCLEFLRELTDEATEAAEPTGPVPPEPAAAPAVPRAEGSTLQVSFPLTDAAAADGALGECGPNDRTLDIGPRHRPAPAAPPATAPPTTHDGQAGWATWSLLVGLAAGTAALCYFLAH